VTSVPRRPLRFGLEATHAASAHEWRELARRAEGSGFSTLHVSDHFGDQVATTPALMAAADATTTLRVGALVLANDYRHPVVVAKEAATIDLLTDGRYELGPGAGWMRSEYEQAGITYDPAPVRFQRFEEAVQIIHGLLGTDPVSFVGAHYRVTGLTGSPTPVQARVPMLIGGGGRRMLGIAGRLADIVSINFNLRQGELTPSMWSNGTPEATEQKIGWVLDSAGERGAEIELHIDVFAVVTDGSAGAVEAVARELGVPAELLTSTPHAAIGTPDQIADLVLDRRERYGFSYVTFMADVLDDLGPVVERLAGA
jgi:probable F420-dependent oxidoreductase